MKNKIFLMLFLSIFLISTPLLAREKYQKGDKEKYQLMKKEKHEEMDKVLSIVKETMVIIKDLNHKPSKEEKKKLAQMINEIEDIRQKRNERRDRMMKK